MNTCLTWNQIIVELPATILITLVLGGLIGGTFVALLKKRA